MKNKILIAVPVIIIIIGIIIFFITKPKNITSQTDNKTTEDIDISINLDNGDEKIDWTSYKTTKIELTKSITINEAGIYEITGTITNGNIKVNTTGNIKLILNNVTITNQEGPTIYIEQAESVLIYLSDNSVNNLTDGTTHTGYEETGAIYSKSDLIFDGNGTLKITSNYEDAIVSKDDLKIINGNYIINSKDDGIRGKDSVYILNGIFDITTQGDGIKSTNETEQDKGYVKIDNGSFKITSELDAIQAVTKVLINNGTFDITTGGGSSNQSTNEKWGYWGKTTTDEQSAKGIKAGDNIVIYDGKLTLNTSDDAIHSNNYVGIKNGTYEIAAGDDGIHADTELIIDSGTINITKSYEGIESSSITINNANINVASSDDGINIAGGNDSSAMGRPGENRYTQNTNNILTINNGTIYIDASGDGIDVNGIAYLNGGTTIVEGPTNNGNGALDYDRGFLINGGTLIALGASGMAQGITNTSKQYGLLVNFNSTYKSGTTIKITDSNNDEIMNYTTKKSFQSLVFSSNKLQQSKKYKITINGTEYTTFSVSNITTTIGNAHNMGNPGVQQGPPRR